MVTLLDLPDGPVLRPVTLRERIAARVRLGALDRALAGGEAPDGDVALMLHARRLIAPRTRRRLARTLQGAVALRRPADGAELLWLAERLQRPGPVEARGVALARLLLGGPLDAGRGRLAGAARAAVAALDAG